MFWLKLLERECEDEKMFSMWFGVIERAIVRF